MNKFRFYKEKDLRWYIDIPTWPGEKADLEMVSGADTLLRIMAGTRKEIWVQISDKSFDKANKLTFIRIADDIGEGAYYKIEDDKIIGNIWLCNVTVSVFGCFPETIYYQLLKN